MISEKQFAPPATRKNGTYEAGKAKSLTMKALVPNLVSGEYFLSSIPRQSMIRLLNSLEYQFIPGKTRLMKDGFLA